MLGSEKTRLAGIPLHELLRNDCHQLPLLETLVNDNPGIQDLRRISAGRIDLFEFRVRLEEHPEFDVAVRGTQMQLVRAFERHAFSIPRIGNPRSKMLFLKHVDAKAVR